MANIYTIIRPFVPQPVAPAAAVPASGAAAASQPVDVTAGKNGGSMKSVQVSYSLAVKFYMVRQIRETNAPITGDSNSGPLMLRPM